MILPELEDGSEPLQIPTLQTRLVDTVQKIGDIGSKVFFDYISLNSESSSSINAVVRLSFDLSRLQRTLTSCDVLVVERKVYQHIF